MEVSHTLTDKPTPRNVLTALKTLPQRVNALVKKYESSTACGFEDFERELHAVFAQTECAVTEEALRPTRCGLAVRVHRRRGALPGLSLRSDLTSPPPVSAQLMQSLLE